MHLGVEEFSIVWPCQPNIEPPNGVYNANATFDVMLPSLPSRGAIVYGLAAPRRCKPRASLDGAALLRPSQRNDRSKCGDGGQGRGGQEGKGGEERWRERGGTRFALTRAKRGGKIHHHFDFSSPLSTQLCLDEFSASFRCQDATKQGVKIWTYKNMCRGSMNGVCLGAYSSH